MKCTKCGVENENGMRFCKKCGEKLVKESRSEFASDNNETYSEREKRLLDLLKVRFGAPLTVD
jgi:uncharacterized membrane protein YvbJ